MSYPLNGRVGGGGEEADSEVEHVDAQAVGDDVPPADAVHTVCATRNDVQCDSAARHVQIFIAKAQRTLKLPARLQNL